MMASPILLAIIFLLIPTRKGKMRTERSLTEMRSSSQQLKARFEATLEKDGFQLVEPADALSIHAVRPREPVTEVYPRNRPALHITIAFVPQGNAVSARVTAEYDDFILLDSGEGWELRNALDRLLSNNPPIGPATRWRSLGSTLLSALIIPILSGLIMLWFWKRSDSGNLNHAGVWGGLVFACVGGLFVARDGGREIRVRPLTLKGLPFVAIAFVLNGACAVAGTSRSGLGSARR